MAAYQECDACGAQMAGYSTDELKRLHGWAWHPIPNGSGQHFIMCGDCEHAYEQRRRQVAELSKAVA